MKLRKTEREKLKQLVADSILNRLTTEETIEYIHNELKVRLKPRYIQTVRLWLKEDMQRSFAELRRDKYAYINEYQQRINEVKDLQRQTQYLYRTSQDGHVRIKCISELHSLALSLVNLYDLLPAITERSFYAQTDSVSPSPEEMDGTTGKEETNESPSSPITSG